MQFEIDEFESVKKEKNYSINSNGNVSFLLIFARLKGDQITPCESLGFSNSS